MELKFEFLEDLPRIEDMENGVVYISLEDKISKHLCACGCGELVVMPIQDVAGVQGWTFHEKDGLYAFSPSVGNYQLPCKSHYWIRNSKALFV